jgi:type IV secretory pathway TrbD component
MDSNTNYSEDLKVIKKVMEESSRFLSLSGLSGLFAGLIAFAGATVAYLVILKNKILLTEEYFTGLTDKELRILKTELIVVLALVLILAIAVSLYFSYRKSLRKELKMWTPVSKRLLINMLIPLVTGGIFIIILYIQNQWKLVIPAMLLFYGLALVNASKFTYGEVFYLGLIEILTGLLCTIFPVYGLVFWCFGFGLLHIAYGLTMYRKYEG